MRLAIFAAVLLAPASFAADGPLARFAFLNGRLEGQGKHPWGAYDEVMEGSWGAGGTVLVVRSRSTMQGRVVFEDVRVFSAVNGRVRMRQFALGDVVTYDVAVDGDTVVFEETSHEGSAKKPWRYTWKLDGAQGFTYRLEEKRGDAFAPYLEGKLERAAPDTGSPGPHGTEVLRQRVKDWQAEIHVPEGDGPFPVVVFSPGGPARTPQGYQSFGKHWASWGYVTLIVAFADDDAKARAPKFGQVLDALAGKVKQKCDLKRCVAAGHSRGAAAALRAAHADERFRAVVAIAPADPGELSDANAPATLLIAGGADAQFLPAARKLHEQDEKRTLVVLEGMTHMLGPREQGLEAIARATAFLRETLVP